MSESKNNKLKSLILDSLKDSNNTKLDLLIYLEEIIEKASKYIDLD